MCCCARPALPSSSRCWLRGPTPCWPCGRLPSARRIWCSCGMLPPGMPGRVELRAIERTPHSLIVRAWAVDRELATEYVYHDVDVSALDERIAFHIAAFELNKYCVQEPETLGFGEWSRFATHAFGA